MSNENDRALLLEHPDWLVLSEASIREGRMRVASEESGRIIGFATYLIAGGRAELEDLFVDPPQMRRGVGTQLVRDVSAQVRALGFEWLEVTANPHALAFYEYTGFIGSELVETKGYAAPRMRKRAG